MEDENKPLAIFYAYDQEKLEDYCNVERYKTALFDIWNEGYRRIKDAKNEVKEEMMRSFTEFINETIESNGLPGF